MRGERAPSIDIDAAFVEISRSSVTLTISVSRMNVGLLVGAVRVVVVVWL